MKVSRFIILIVLIPLLCGCEKRAEKTPKDGIEATSPTNNMSEVHIAARDGDKKALMKLIETGVGHKPYDYILDYYCPPLHLAIENGHTEIVNLLLESGVRVYEGDLDYFDRKCGSPVWPAVLNSRPEILELLLQKGSSPNAKNEEGYTPLDIAESQGDEEIAEILKAHGGKYADTIHDWVIKGNLDKVKELVEKDVSVLDLQAPKGFSADRSEAGNTPLHFAAAQNNIEIAKYLLKKGADVNAGNVASDPPLYYAIKQGNEEMVDLFLENGADPMGEGHEFRITPLHAACLYGHIGLAEKFINLGADVNAKTVQGDTPLHNAVAKSHAETVKLLLENGAEVSAKNGKSSTGHYTVLIMGWSPIHLAHDLEIAKILVEHGADVNEKDDAGRTPLILNARYPEVVKFLVSKGADVNLKDDFHETPLQIAVRSCSMESIKTLLENGANVNTADDRGDTLYRTACDKIFGPVNRHLHGGEECNMREMFTLLLSDGGDVNTIDAKMSKSLKEAKSNEELCEIFIKN